MIQRALECDGAAITRAGWNQGRMYRERAILVVADQAAVLHTTLNLSQERFDFPETAFDERTRAARWQLFMSHSGGNVANCIEISAQPSDEGSAEDGGSADELRAEFNAENSTLNRRT